jgi:hypothetical protein
MLLGEPQQSTMFVHPADAGRSFSMRTRTRFANGSLDCGASSLAAPAASASTFRRIRLAVLIAAQLASFGCGQTVNPSDGGAGADGSAPRDASAPRDSAGRDANTCVHATTRPIVISTSAKTPTRTTRSVNYWQWPAAYGDWVTGTATLIASLAPAVLRIGGYNNDANTPAPFDDAALDAAVAYARAIGAEPLIQVPLLADTNGKPPTAATAAGMVTYANVTKAYGVKYFSIGNEPDEYSSQGSLTDASLPAIPGYTPADYCASAQAYVAAMKAVDSSISIVGPDLAWQYTAANNWLSPILQTCGALFDIVSIHRYPFEAAQATLPAASSDVTSFRDVIAEVRGLMQAAGYGDKPLALTEMNIVYDATPPASILAASPGTVPSGLWMADALGAARSLALWTSAAWDISDPDNYSLGLLGPPPSHTPRPEYHAYALYASYAGPTLVDVSTAPPGLNAYASRNEADDATLVIAVNWNTSDAPVTFDVRGPTPAPAAASYIVPALSLSAFRIPDRDAATAVVYGSAEHDAGTGPKPLAAGTCVPADGGGEEVSDANGDTAATQICPAVALPGATVTILGAMAGTTPSFGPASDPWGSYSYAATGQPLPTATVTPDGAGFVVTASFSTPTTDANNYDGFGLYYSSPSCVDASSYTGVQFDVSAADLGGCTLAFSINFSADDGATNDPTRGSCVASTCYGPSAAVPPGATSVKIPFASLTGGVPVATLDAKDIVSIQWQLSAPILGANGGLDAGPPDGGLDSGSEAGVDGGLEGGPEAGPDAAPRGGGVSATFTIENVAFY